MLIKKRAPAHHSSLNTKQDCLKIVDTFRGVPLSADMIVCTENLSPTIAVMKSVKDGA